MICEFTREHAEGLKDLLLELQQNLCELDANGILAVTENYRENYYNFVLAETELHGGRIFVAKEGEKVIGAVICKTFRGGGEADITTNRPKIGFISDVIVTENARGKGTGKRLIKAAEGFFKDVGCDFVQLEVCAHNVRAAGLYKSAGFEVSSLYMTKKI